MRRKYKLSGIILAVLMFTSACGGGNGVVNKEVKRKASTGDSWTVMIYMSASVMEEKYKRASEVLNSLSYDLPENINVVLQTGGCRRWDMEGIKNDRIQEFEVQKNGIRLIGEGLLKNMGDSDNYADFLSRTMERYPADNYISVIWGEGGGPLGGAGYDSSFNYDSLSLADITDALAKVGQKIDILGFDASMMSSLETASALPLYADYMVAPQDVMPMSGWDYKGLFEYLSQNPHASAQMVGQVICDGVLKEAEGDEAELVIMALTDLSKATKLVQAFDTTARHMSQSAEDINVLRSMTECISKSRRVGANTEWEGYSNLTDLSSLAECVFKATSDDAARLDNVIAQTVIYTASDALHSDMCGLNIYYPSTPADLGAYREVCPSDGYTEYLGKVFNSSVSTASRDYYNNAVQTSSVSAVADLNGVYTLSATNPEIITRAGVNIYSYNEDEGKYMHLITDYNTERLSNNTFVYELTDRQMQINGIPVSAHLIYEGEKYSMYSVPVLYDKAVYNIRVKKVVSDRKNEYKVMGLWEGIDAESGLVCRRYKMLEVGDVITPIYKIYGEDGYIKGKSIRLVFGGLNISEKTVADGDYAISYLVEDIYNNRVQTDAVNVTAIKGKFKVIN